MSQEIVKTTSPDTPIPQARSYTRFIHQARSVMGDAPIYWILHRFSDIYRWGSIEQAPPKLENDKQHIIDMFHNHDSLIAAVPELVTKGYIDQRQIQTMFLIHDVPEIIVGDLSHQHPDYEKLKPIYKRREETALRRMIGVFENASSANREKMKNLRSMGLDPMELYLRFESHVDGDSNAILAKYHDYEQAILKAEPLGLLEALNHNTNIKTVKLAAQFIVTIPDEEVRDKLINYFKKTLSGLGELPKRLDNPEKFLEELKKENK